jgi:multidrug efflux pump subunit AcrA (membrane-fusion protein)
VILIIAGLTIALATRDKDGDKVMQKTEVVKRGDLVVKINASGNLESLITVEVKSNVEGEIESLLVEEGDFVEKDQVLLQIDDKQIREDMKQAEANVRAAKAQLEQSERSLNVKDSQLDSDLQQQRDSVTQAQINYDAAKATTIQQISQQETDIQNAIEALEQDRISLRQAEISLKQAQLTLSELKQSADAAKVDLENAKSELSRTQELYEKKFVAKKSLEDTQAALANATSRYDSAQKRILSQEETIKSQKETIDMRERAIKTRERTIEFEKQNLGLLKQTRAAQEQQALTQLNIAQTRLKQLEENITDEKDINRLSLESANASLLRAQSTLNNQMERLGWTTIKAPMSGIVINLEIEEGEIVTSGRSAFSQSPPLMQIVDLSQMVVETSINEVDMEKLELGQKAEIRIRAYPDKVYEGEVREISPSGQPRDNIIYFEIVVAVLGSPKELRPGMTADVDIIVLEHKNTLILPIEAVKRERRASGFGGGPGAGRGGRSQQVGSPGRGGAAGSPAAGTHYVMLAPKDKDAAGDEAAEGIKTFVQVGEQNDMFIEILGGLNEGDEVIIQSTTLEIPDQFGRRRR